MQAIVARTRRRHHQTSARKAKRPTPSGSSPRFDHWKKYYAEHLPLDVPFCNTHKHARPLNLSHVRVDNLR